MSDKILRALMQLFALVAENHISGSHSRVVVELFLKQQLNTNLVAKYLEIFDEFILQSQGKAGGEKHRKRISAISVKVLSICTNINKELNLRQKYIVLLRLLEFMLANGPVTEQENEFAKTVADVFNISPEEYDACFLLVTHPGWDQLPDSPLFLRIDDRKDTKEEKTLHLYHESMGGVLWMLYLKSAGIFFLRYKGDDPLFINGQPVANDRLHVFTQGAVIRGTRTEPLYYSDVARIFFNEAAQNPIRYETHEIEFRFPGGKTGLQELSFNANSGNMVAIMGGSGAGKSTLLNVLNGNMSPSKGKVLINGINLHEEKKKLEGAIGYIQQDDMLIEDLSVYQNLFYSSKLCFGDLDDAAIKQKVDALLESIGLSESKNLKVGNALNPKISGGQRKRLNIALELIREPAVLFVDEPTSGLSSRDSENVMDLLKQLAISGKLVFVVIHQPSSDIFKLFDKLLLLDIGGYPVYYGNPSDSLIYFKRLAEYANAEESECITCGNINPEQIFSVLEARVLDEYGNQQNTRKVTPDKWNQYFKKNAKAQEAVPDEQGPLKNEFIKPSLWKQFTVFAKRDILSKLSNRQYLLITFLEAPALAFVLAFLVKYHKSGDLYSFFDNPNLPAYLFMAVIVALFLGLTVSAEEIFRDRKILKRESFLNLSYGGYLWSKITVLFIISALQSLLFVFIGNTILGVRDMFTDYWLVFFTASCFANLVGLNISSAFNSAVTIYILIPIVIIPQLLLSGVIVKFEKLNPSVSSPSKVPLLGEVMASRWAFEALAVNQFSNNEYEKNFFPLDKLISQASFQTKFRISRLEDELAKAESMMNSKDGKEDLPSTLELIRTELNKEIQLHPTLSAFDTELLSPGKFTMDAAIRVKKYLGDMNKFYIDQYNNVSRKKDELILSYQPDEESAKKFNQLKKNYTNSALDDLVLNRNDQVQILVSGNRIIQRFQPVFTDGSTDIFLRTGFYANRKNVFGTYVDTFGANLAVIWSMTVILVFALYFNLLKKFILWIERLWGR